jgi:hypothetical protein
MRFTVTLDSDVALNLKKLMAVERLTFKDAVNQTMVRGFSLLERQRGTKKTKKSLDGGVK